jgi:hypothetical protein
MEECADRLTFADELSRTRSEAGKKGGAGRWASDGKPDGKTCSKSVAKQILPSPNLSPANDLMANAWHKREEKKRKDEDTSAGKTADKSIEVAHWKCVYQRSRFLASGSEHAVLCTARVTLQGPLPLTLVILSEARVNARASRRTPRMPVVTMLRQGVLPKHSRANALMRQCRGHCTGVLRLYLAPLVARVPLRMTECEKSSSPTTCHPEREREGPAPLPHRGSPEDPRSRFLACGSEQHVVVFAARITSLRMTSVNSDQS